MPFYNDQTNVEIDMKKRFNYIDPQYKFIFWPKRCYLSGKFMWLEYAYRKTFLWVGPGEPIVEHRWYSKEEYIIDQLKR